MGATAHRLWPKAELQLNLADRKLDSHHLKSDPRQELDYSSSSSTGNSFPVCMKPIFS